MNQANPLQSDRSDHGKRGGFIAHGVRDFGAKILGDADNFRMFAVGCHPVSHGESRHPRSHLEHRSNIAVAHRQWLIKFVPNRFQRWHDPVSFHLVQHHSNFLRLLTSFLNEVGLAKIHQHALGTC